MLKPFVLLQARPETPASDNEYEAYMKISGLEPNQLRRLRIDNGDVPELKLEHYSGILMGGSPYTISDPASKKTKAQQKCEAGLYQLMRQIIQQDFPFLGECYVVGIVTKLQNGKLSRRYWETVSATQIELTAEGRRDKLTEGLSEPFLAFTGHKDACEVLPKGSVLLATSPTCPVQLFRIKNNVYVVQFHTELDAPGFAIRIQLYKNNGYFEPEEAESLIDMVHRQKVTEPEKILRRFVKNYMIKA